MTIKTDSQAAYFSHEIYQQADKIEQDATDKTTTLTFINDDGADISTDVIEYAMIIKHFRVQVRVRINGRDWWTGIELSDDHIGWFIDAGNAAFAREQRAIEEKQQHNVELCKRLGL